MPTLKELREYAFLSQRELADKAKVNYVTIARIEGGKIAKPRPATIRALAKALSKELETKIRPGDIEV